MAALALQFGLQPLIQKKFLNKKEINLVTLLVVIELTKITISTVTMGRSVMKDCWKDWSIQSSLKAAAVPAALYALQNWLAQVTAEVQQFMRIHYIILALPCCCKTWSSCD